MYKIKAFLIIFFVGVMISGCSGQAETLPEETIEELEYSMNSMDIQGILNCLDESTQSTITSGMDLMLGITSAITGIDIGSFIDAESLIDLAPLFQEFSSAYGFEMPEGQEQVDFTDYITYIRGDKATVYFVESNSGQEMYLNMVKEDGQWLLTIRNIQVSPEEAERVFVYGEEVTKETEAEDSVEAQFDSIVEQIQSLLKQFD